MDCLKNNAAVRRYLGRFFAAMSAYVVLIVCVSLAVHRLRPHGLLLYGLSVLPALPIIAVIVVVGLYLREEKDEFQRDLFIQTMLWGLGGTLAITSTWGLLESYAHIVHFQPMLTFPLFWMIVGVSAPLLNRRYR